jgi:alanyl-tRNA synthetase
VRSTAEIGVFHILTETSSAANVRRIEALTGPAAAELLRHRERLLADASATLRTRPEDVPDAVRTLSQERRRLEKAVKERPTGTGEEATPDIERLAGEAHELPGGRVLAAIVEVPDAKALLDVLDRVKGRLDDAAIVLGAAVDGRAHLVVSVAPSLVERGLRAGEIVKAAAAVVGGGGGGRDTMAQAGGRDPERLPQAIETARTTIASALEA